MKKIFIRIFLMLSLVCWSLQIAAQEVNLYFIRHGKTMFNTTGQVQGWSDTPLTEKGMLQAKQAGIGLSNIVFTSAYSSDMGRARSTAKIILAENKNSSKLELIDMIELREWGYGGYEGRDDAELWMPLFKEKNIQFKKDWSTWEEFTKVISDEEMANAIAKNDKTGTAENYNEIVSRLKKGVLNIIEQTELKKGGDVLVVSHGSAIPTILTIFTPDSYHGESIDNVSLTILSYKDGLFTLKTIGDKKYLLNN